MCIFESQSEACYNICIVVGRNETFWKKFARMSARAQVYMHMWAVLVGRRWDNVADHIQAKMFLRGTVLAKKRRIERRKVGSRKRWANYLSVRCRTRKLALAKIFGALYHPLPIERTPLCKAMSSNWWGTIVTLSFKDKDWLRNINMKKQHLTSVLMN